MSAEIAEETKEETISPPLGIYFLPEPTFLQPDFQEAVPGSTRILRTVARLTSDEAVELLTAEEVKALEEAEPNWREEAVLRADGLVAGLESATVRDPEGVILAIVLDGGNPVTCAALFSRELVRQYEDLLGPEFYVAVPTRFRMYLFPKLASRIAEFAPAVLSDYRVSPHPVSAEVMEVSKEGVSVVGKFDDR